MSVLPSLTKTVLGALSSLHSSRASGFAAQDHAQVRDSNAVQGNTRTWRPLWQAYQGNRLPELQQEPKAKPPLPTVSIFQSDCHQLRIQLTGAYAREECQGCSEADRRLQLTVWYAQCVNMLIGLSGAVALSVAGAVQILH